MQIKVFDMSQITDKSHHVVMKGITSYVLSGIHTRMSTDPAMPRKILRFLAYSAYISNIVYDRIVIILIRIFIIQF